jgi:hypothetical protein
MTDSLLTSLLSSLISGDQTTDIVPMDTYNKCCLHFVYNVYAAKRICSLVTIDKCRSYCAENIRETEFRYMHISNLHIINRRI